MYGPRWMYVCHDPIPCNSFPALKRGEDKRTGEKGGKETREKRREKERKNNKVEGFEDFYGDLLNPRLSPTRIAAGCAVGSFVSGHLPGLDPRIEDLSSDLVFVVVCNLFWEMEDVKPVIPLQSDEGGAMEARFADLCKVLPQPQPNPQKNESFLYKMSIFYVFLVYFVDLMWLYLFDWFRIEWIGA